MSWSPEDEKCEAGTLFLVFQDQPGTLAAVIAAIAQHSIDIFHVSAFCTTDSVAVDTLELSCFHSAAADSIRERLMSLTSPSTSNTVPASTSRLRRKSPPSTTPFRRESAEPAEDSFHEEKRPYVDRSDDLVSELPEDYLNATTPEERASHAHMHSLLRSGTVGDVVLRWGPTGSGGVLLHMVFVDCTLALCRPISTIARSCATCLCPCKRCK